MSESTFKWPLGFKLEPTPLSKRAYFSAQASAVGGYFVLCNQGPGIPYCGVVNGAFIDNDTAELPKSWVLRLDNQGSYENFRAKDWPFQVYGTLDMTASSQFMPNITIDSTDTKTTVNIKLMIPFDALISQVPRFPVRMRCYGGPTSQLVDMRAQISFDTYFSSWYRTVVAVVDGRGTGFKGRDFRSIVSKRLGTYESLDQVSAGDILKSWVNSPDGHNSPQLSLGIWGWSFGGFLTLKTLESSSGLFDAGVSVAPVVDWRYYDSVYTERYMKLPVNNPGYATSAVHNLTGFLTGKTWTLVAHGIADGTFSPSLAWRLT